MTNNHRPPPHEGDRRSFVIAAAALSLALVTGCHGSAEKPVAPVASGGALSPAAAITPLPSRDTAAHVKRPAFDSEKAYRLLVKQCDFGPRPVGSAAHDKTRAFLLEEMRKYADKTVAQDFTYQGHPLTNIIGVFNPDAKPQILVCAHWDTRPTADQELDEAKRKQPIPGADDGASGVAVLLEMARNFKEQKPQVGVVMILLDGEDYGSFEKDEGVLLGARYFAKHHEGYDPKFGILLDMVGNKNLSIYREPNSEKYAPDTNEKFFRVARELGYGKYIIDQQGAGGITDDHIPLIKAQIPTIDIIDFNYGPWHTLEDTPDKCSAEALGIVGNTLAELVYREK
jgi:hypothetical protein